MQIETPQLTPFRRMHGLTSACPWVWLSQCKLCNPDKVETCDFCKPTWFIAIQSAMTHMMWKTQRKQLCATTSAHFSSYIPLAGKPSAHSPSR